ncbi:MAG: NAD-dependent epimerase/dehydratase family protein [Terriglobales bacterium]|jgi:GDP-L-fucose synthase
MAWGFLMIQRDDTILITGGSGLAGINLREYLQSQGFRRILAPPSAECDLTNRQPVLDYFERNQPDYVFHMAGFVRGIMYNMRNHGEAYLKNTLINTHVIEACHTAGVKKVVAMGSVAMYPELEPGTPLAEGDVWKGPPHPSQYGYAQAKRGMLTHLQMYESSYGMPYAFAFCTSLYGPHDRFNTETGHVIPSLVKKFHDARQTKTTVSVWGDGSAHRDFLYIQDCARALHIIMDHVTGPVNLASGTTRKIRDVVNILAAHTRMEEQIVWDTTKPSGYVFRAYDVSRLRDAGFACQYTLEQALRETYDWYASHSGAVRH